MFANSPVILILGAGPRIGVSVGKAFAAKGYKVAFASRKASSANDTADEVHVQGDFSEPGSIADIFAKVKAKLGAPSVVLYNASASAVNPANEPLATQLADFTKDFNINTASAFMAAQQAVAGFATLPSPAPKTFIYTGNITNEIVIPQIVDSGVGKSAAAHIIQAAASAYTDRGYKFYYVDQRNEDGSAVYGALDGDAHAKLFLELSEDKSQRPWQQTFVAGTGYKSFPRI